MTCEDCIHYDICANQNKLVQTDEHTWYEFAEIDNVEDYCSHFKDKHNLVEAVRCKDCEYRHTANCSAKHERADMDYCSHGVERWNRRTGR